MGCRLGRDSESDSFGMGREGLRCGVGEGDG